MLLPVSPLLKVSQAATRKQAGHNKLGIMLTVFQDKAIQNLQYTAHSVLQWLRTAAGVAQARAHCYYFCPIHCLPPTLALP